MRPWSRRGTTPSGRCGSDITDVQSRDIAAFPAVVAQIKNMDPPTFASKFCHFLAGVPQLIALLAHV